MLPKAVLTLPFTVESTGMTDEAGLGGEELSPTDAAILEMIREGRYDAEIASRLFISTADVKARIERMLAQGGLRERSDFIALPEQEAEAPALDSPPSRRQPRTMSVHNAILAVVGALAIGGGVGWVVRDEQAGREPEQNGPGFEDLYEQILRNPAVHLETVPSGTVAAAHAQTALASVVTYGPVEGERGVVLPSLTWADAMRLLGTTTVGPSPSAPRTGFTPTPSGTGMGTLFRTENGAYAVNALGPDGEGGKDIVFVNTALIDLSAGNWTIDRLSNNRLTLATRFRDNTLVLRLEPSNAATSIDRTDGAIRISSTDGSTPKVNMKLDGALWSLGLDGRLVVYL